MDRFVGADWVDGPVKVVVVGVVGVVGMVGGRGGWGGFACWAGLVEKLTVTPKQNCLKKAKGLLFYIAKGLTEQLSYKDFYFT